MLKRFCQFLITSLVAGTFVFPLLANDSQESESCDKARQIIEDLNLDENCEISAIQNNKSLQQRIEEFSQQFFSDVGELLTNPSAVPIIFSMLLHAAGACREFPLPGIPDDPITNFPQTCNFGPGTWAPANGWPWGGGPFPIKGPY